MDRVASPPPQQLLEGRHAEAVVAEVTWHEDLMLEDLVEREGQREDLTEEEPLEES